MKIAATAVYFAVQKISSAWDEELNAAQSLPKEEQLKILNDFCAAVAIEIVNAIPEEELNEMT